MATPEKYLKIMAKFQRALKKEDYSEIDAIPLEDLKKAKNHLYPDRNDPGIS